MTTCLVLVSPYHLPCFHKTGLHVVGLLFVCVYVRECVCPIVQHVVSKYIVDAFVFIKAVVREKMGHQCPP